MTDRLLIAVLGLTLLIVVGCLACDCSQPKPIPPTTFASDAGLCAVGIGPASPAASCDGRFTVDGLACAVCPVHAGCLAKSLMIYCVNSCADRACVAGKHRK